jgi:hypothetical protein
MTHDLVCELLCKNYYGHDDAVLIEFILANPNDEDVWILPWFTSLDGLRHDAFSVFDADGRKVPYDGILVKRGRPTKASFLRLEAGSSRRSVIDLSKAYKIRSAGEYKVQADTYILVLDSLWQGDEPPAFENIPFEKVISQVASFVVEFGGEERWTIGEFNRLPFAQREALRSIATHRTLPTGAVAPQFNGGTPAQQGLVLQAHSAAYGLTMRALGWLRNDDRYEYWFGSFTGSRFAAVLDVFSRIKAGFESTPFLYDLTGSDCRCDMLAHTTPGGTTIWVCGLFFKTTVPLAGVLLHEHSHASGNTEDNPRFGGSQDGAHRLARLFPDEAISNANSYEYFSET